MKMKKQIITLALGVLTIGSAAFADCVDVYQAESGRLERIVDDTSVDNLISRYNSLAMIPLAVVSPISTVRHETSKTRQKSLDKVLIALEDAKKGDGIAIRTFQRDVSNKSHSQVELGEVIQALLNANSLFQICLQDKPLGYGDVVLLVAESFKK